MAIEDQLRNFNLFVDAVGKAGNIEEFTPPKLTVKTEDHRAGGMDAPVGVDVGMEKLEASFTLTAVDAGSLKLFGLAPGKQVGLTAKGSLISEDGSQKAYVCNVRGSLKEVDQGTLKPGEIAKLKLSMEVRYYKLTIADEVLHEIDVPGMRRVINGVDQLELTRQHMGL